jgi:CheY-like chemotaxis protein
MKKTKPNSPCRVLVIDDEAAFTRMIKISLEEGSDYLVEVVNESPKACAAARAFKPDIILLDVVMPEADGGDVATAIRNHPATSGIPIIFVSAMVSRQESGAGLYQSGGEHFLAKPVSREILTSSIKQILGSSA